MDHARAGYRSKKGPGQGGLGNERCRFMGAERERFAVQALGVTKELGLSMDKVNVNGGAVAIGHPIGASGARILVTLIHAMIRRDVHKGVAALCLGGGNSVALAVER